MGYARVAKPFVSLGEMNPSAFAGFPLRRGPKRKDREINGGFGARAADVARLCDSEMAPKPLESLKTDSEMAPGRFVVEGKDNRSGEFRINPCPHLCLGRPDSSYPQRGSPRRHGQFRR
jgi:hypothetical protein